MKVAGEATVHAPIDRVWQALRDPAVLVRTIPGCERLEAAGPGMYLLTVTAGVASTEGTYSGTVRVYDMQPQSSFAMNASAAGVPGTLGTDVQVRLSEVDGSTLVSYDADAAVGGLIGGMGQRMLTSVMRKTAAEFFAAIDDALAGKAPAAGVAQAAPAAKHVPPGLLVGAALGFALGALWGRRVH
jgi:carbon monoxide dehydrogenase subunit G